MARVINQANWPQREYFEGLQALTVYSRQTAEQHLLDAKLHFLLANSYLYLGIVGGSISSLEQAKAYYENIIPRLTPADRPDVIYNLAQSYYELSLLDQSKTEEYYQKALDILVANSQRFPQNLEAKDKLKILSNS